MLMRLQEDVSKGRLIQASYELSQREAYIHDLTILAAGGGAGLQSALYRQQYQKFQATLAEQAATLKKLRNDLDIYNTLYADKVVAQKNCTIKSLSTKGYRPSIIPRFSNNAAPGRKNSGSSAWRADACRPIRKRWKKNRSGI
ncbi:hypothetical protein MKQ70_10050 [Chitinophaga sedimenti]|uniref:hypothetical protein n=1 Tax=Chitinophaga sedimenti TaxID=2033606 RepID=UPI00200441CA|nr:hypothetical protein [Chitinophaga sedimenti]MCK7555324.1 hypothetical protein [Chitinophaga sedimenti]